VMKLVLQRLSADWQQAYGHPVLVVESFVDGQLFRGTSYYGRFIELEARLVYRQLRGRRPFCDC
jgi:hypothetical protein